MFWGADIGKHQWHRYLAGMQPVRSVANVCHHQSLVLSAFYTREFV
jgi:hypothetical protein